MTDAGLIGFIHEEAALLDAGLLDDWLGLCAEDGRYGLPPTRRRAGRCAPAQLHCLRGPVAAAVAHRRLKGPRAHSQHPRSGYQHVLQGPRVIARDEPQGGIRLRTPFVYVEARGQGKVALSGRYTHTLAPQPDGLRIREKRVDLVGAGRALPMLQLFP